jgi:hypothetical protein
MKRASIMFAFGLSFLPQIAYAQSTDCNALARDLVVKNFQSSWSDYSKLLFLSSLTTMDLKTSSEALGHSGQVSVGPISIGPGTWNKEKQDQLRSDLQKIVNIEQLRQSAASVSISSGDPDTIKAVQDCLTNNGGLFLALSDLGKDHAVVELRWTSYPGTHISAVVDGATVVHGKIIGGNNYTKPGAKLGDRLSQRVTIKRDDPKEDLAIIVNTTNGGSAQGYLPPSELPPPHPVIRVAIDGDPIEVGSGERYDGFRNPGCQAHASRACVRPQHGGKIVAGSGRAKITVQVGNSGTRDPVEHEEEYCVSFWASTGACETPVFIKGSATATEEYLAPE